MRRVRRSLPEVRLDMTPLIDVVFLLLTFFVFSMVLMVRAQVLDVDLPALTAGRAGERVESITVAVDQRGAVFVNGDAVELDALPGKIEDLRAGARPGVEETPVVIAVDAGGRAGRLIEVADVLTGAGISRFSVIGRPSDAARAPAGDPEGGSL